MSFNPIYVKQDGITLKQRQLMLPFNEIDIVFLNSASGLQPSLCTGVARRVSLRVLLADVMVPIVESRLSKPFHWEALKVELAMAQDFCQGLETWFGAPKPGLRETAVCIVRSMLEVLQDTGINKKGDEIVLAWVRKESPYSCLRIRLDKSNDWLRILTDSETCAISACIAPLCFECGKHKCRGVEVASWEPQIYALETAVCLSLCDYELANPVKTLVGWAAHPKASYLGWEVWI